MSPQIRVLALFWKQISGNLVKEILWWSTGTFHLPSCFLSQTLTMNPWDSLIVEVPEVFGACSQLLVWGDGWSMLPNKKDQKPCGSWSSLGHHAWMTLPYWLVLSTFRTPMFRGSWGMGLNSQDHSCLSLWVVLPPCLRVQTRLYTMWKEWFPQKI